MTLIKYLQRKTYDVLSDKPLILFVVLLLLIFFVVCQVYEFYILSTSDILRSVCDNRCCRNIGSICSPCEPIDAVYTWVNGSDPVWLEQMNKYVGLEGVKFDKDHDPSRYDDKQELKYSLRSLEKYAPWIRRVYVVTAGQLPWWLDVRNPHLQLVTHEEIIPEEYLPTFSSPTIECFIHKIPGLSEKFLYLNDDVFLGGPLYLSDLHTETDGYEVYTSWNVPDCAHGCPWSFLGDRSCDSPCNNAECDYDSGDCLGDPKTRHYGVGNALDYLGDYPDAAFFDEDDKIDYTDMDNAGRYPGFDEQTFDSKIFQARQHEDQDILDGLRREKRNTQINIDPVDIEDKFWGVKNLMETDIVNEKKSMRSLKFAPRIKGKTLEERDERFFNKTVVHKKSVESSQKVQFKLSNNITNHVAKPQNVYQKPKGNFISKLVKVSYDKVNISGAVNTFNKNFIKTEKKFRKRKKYGEKIKEETKKKDDRKLPMYAQSLIHTNKIFNKAYGFQNRKVPAHVPYLMEKRIIEELQIKFKDHVRATVRNKFRRGNDFQFGFAYFHYLMSEKGKMTIEEIFDQFDTDNSGTWSDREVRTVLARVRGLPLTVEIVRALEAAARQCDKEEYRTHPTPSHERYLDSEMPTLTKALISECEGIRKPLLASLGTRKPRAVARSASPRHTFAMLESNITKAVGALDEIRRETKKFICINDNLDPTREEESIIVRMMLQELYEALLPLPSRFELPLGVGNRFLRLSELQEWQEGRRNAWLALSVCAAILLFISVYHVNNFLKNSIHRLHMFF